MRRLLLVVILCGGACKDKGGAATAAGSGSAPPAAKAVTDAGPSRERWSATFVVGAALRDLPIAFTPGGTGWTGSRDAGGTTGG